MELMLTIVIIFSVVMSVQGQGTVSCRASFNCAGGTDDDLGVEANGEACCLGNPNALAYTPVGSEDCFACVVVGFINPSFSGFEQGSGHSVPVGYLKGGTIAGQNLVFDVRDTPGTAREGSQFDYKVNTLRARALANGQISNVVLTFRVDRIAQESNETFTLTLDPLVTPNPREGLFFRNSIQVTIRDSDSVEFFFPTSNNRANEPDSSNPNTFLFVSVVKSARIASRVELVVVPLTVDEARASSLPLPPNIPQNDPRSPPFANLADFDNTNITLVFEPDEDSLREVNEIYTPISVTDDAINEATEQVFVAELILVSSLDSATVDLTVRPSTLCRIIDNDSIRIGFELPGYTYTEPLYDEFIDNFYVSPTCQPENGPIFLLKEDNVISEQTFLVSFQVTDSAPSGTQSATIDQDYRFAGPGQTSTIDFFLPTQQRLFFPFELRADILPEGTEAFQASVSPEYTQDINGMVEQFPTSLNPLTLRSDIFITILDNDPIIIGFTNTSYTVDEGIGTLQVDVRVLYVPDDQPLPASVDVVIQSVSGSATGGRDYQEIRVNFFDVFLTFDDAVRQQSFPVTIINDSFFEVDVEDFALELRFDPFALEPPSDVILNPNVSTVKIRDDDTVVIGFLNTSYTVNENDGAANIQIGVIQGSLERSVVVRFSTSADSASVLTFSSFMNLQTVNVNIEDDDLLEIDEIFRASLALENPDTDSRVQLRPDSADVTILDENMTLIGFNTNGISLTESNGTVALVVSVLNMTIGEGNTVRVRITTADDSANGPVDYIPISEVITFSSSSITQTVHVSLVNDQLLEINEVFTASLSLEDETDRGHIQLNPSSASITVIDDDDAVIGFVPPTYSVVEGVDRFANLTIQLISGQLGREVIVNFDTQSGSAIDGLDYSAVLSRSLSFGPSVSSHVVRVGILDDVRFEKDVENFTATLSADNVIPRLHLGVQMATVNITDNEIVRIGFQSAQYNVSEASAITTIITIEALGGSLEREIIISFSTHDSTATAGEDYVGLSYRLTFDSSNTISVVPLIILDDEADENMEAMSASLSFPGLATERVLLEPNTTVVRIYDDDHADIGFISSHFTVRESDSEVNIQVGVLSGSLQKEVAIIFSITELNAFVGEDYHEPQSLSLELTLDSTTSTQISIPIINNDIFELTESFLVNISLIGASSSQNSTRVLILDDDELVFGFSPSKYEVHEGDGSVMIKVIFFQGIPGDYQPVVLISIHNGTATEGEDFGDIASSEVTFTAGNRVNSVTITIIPNNSTESSEEFTVTLDKIILLHRGIMLNLSEKERARLVLNPEIAAVKIIDDDVAVIGFLNTNLTIFEGDEVNFTIGVLQGYLDTTVTILFTAEASSAQAGLDYTETSKLLNFTEDSVQIVSIQIIDDGNPEPSDTFLGQLSSADGVIIPPNVLLQPNRATATIINENDLPTESSTIDITVLIVGLVSTLVFFTVLTVSTIVVRFVFKKKRRKSLNLQEHVYESVLQPPRTLVTFSEPSKLDSDSLYDEVKTTSCSTATQFELTDNKAYCSSSSKPPAEEDEAAPGTDPE